MEFKYSDAPSITRSMRVVMDDLAPHHLWIVYRGDATWQLDERITATPVSRMDQFARV